MRTLGYAERVSRQDLADAQDYQHTGNNRLSTASDEFDDDGWGTFNSSGNDDADNPFGDDNFAPSVQHPAQGGPSSNVVQRSDPLTPHDWASEFDREFADELPAIVVPNIPEDEEEEEDATEAGFGGSPATSWGFSGKEDEGEDLPPSPIVDQAPQLGAPIPHPIKSAQDVDTLVQQTNAIDIRDIPRESALPETTGQSPTSPMTIPRRASATNPDPSSPKISTSPVKSSTSPKAIPARRQSEDDSAAFSPPEPSLINASTMEEPLGPGVSPDTHMMPSGMLEKEVNGQKVTVPADEVARGVEEAMTSGSPEQVGKLEKVKSID